MTKAADPFAGLLDVEVVETDATLGDRCARTYCRALLTGRKAVAYLSDGQVLDICPDCLPSFMRLLEARDPGGRAN